MAHHEIQNCQLDHLYLFSTDKSYQESLQALQVAQNARHVKNQVKINVDETTNIINDLREEIARIRDKIAKAPEGNKEDVMRMQVRTAWGGLPN